MTYNVENLFDIPSTEIVMTFFEGKQVVGQSSSGISENNPLSGISLLQNYPNPFSSTTTIQFSLEKNQNVKLSVIDIQGNEIAKIIEGNMEAGQHLIEFDGNNYKSGQYFYKIETDNFTKIKKMILMK